MSNKKINAYYDSTNKRIVIDDVNVQNGDYIDVANGSIAQQIFESQLTDEVKNNVILEYKETPSYKNIINQYDNKINSLKEENTTLSQKLNTTATKLEEQEKTIQTKINNAVLEFKNTEYSDLKDKYNTLLNENSNLKTNIESAKDQAVKDFIIGPKYTELTKKLAKQEEQIKYIPAQVIDEFKKSDEYKELKEKAERRAGLNSKALGERLENFCQEEYRDKLQIFDNTNWEKTTTAKNGKKPDFLFTVYTDEKKDVKIASIVLEMKTATSNHSNNKMDQYLETLEINRINFGAEFALLVNDLEIDTENDFILKKAAGWSRIFIVRPQYFAYVLILFKVIYEKSSELVQILKRESVGKEEILKFIEDFKIFREDLFTKTIENIKTKLEAITSDANKIIKSAENIIEATAVIKDSHLRTVDKKVSDYLNKIIKRENKFKEEN